MKTILAVIGAVALLLIFGLFALRNDDDESDSLGRLQWASHEYGGCDPYYEPCDGYDDGYGDGRGGQDYDYDYGSHDRNRNRGRDRGAFSPGPFRDSPVTICLPYSCNSGGEQSGGNRNDGPRPDERGRA